MSIGKRADWHTYFMQIAAEAAARSTCDFSPTGAVIVKEKRILSTGYTGSVRGLPHCDEVGHPPAAKNCENTISGEINAVLLAARNGISIAGASLYTTGAPDWFTFKHLAGAGLTEIYHLKPITDELVLRFAGQTGVKLIHFKAAE